MVNQVLKVGIAGFGNVGKEVVRHLNAGVLPEVELVAVAVRDLEKARAQARAFTPPPRIVTLPELPQLSDVVVECATAAAFPEIARAVLTAGKFLICVSAGGVPNCPELVDLARQHGGRVRVASGALPGLDMIRCAAEGTLSSVCLQSHIKPESMAHEPYVLDRGYDFTNHPPREAIKLFEGAAGEAASLFPRHFNVAVSLSLAGIGFSRTRVEIWIDPDIPGTIHEVEAEGEEIALSMTSRNRPSANPRTSRIVAPSIIAALRAMVAPLTAGS
jgi:aspartate dehydrogenase